MTHDAIMLYLIVGEAIAFLTLCTQHIQGQWKNGPVFSTIVTVITLIVAWPLFFLFTFLRKP